MQLERCVASGESLLRVEFHVHFVIDRANFKVRVLRGAQDVRLRLRFPSVGALCDDEAAEELHRTDLLLGQSELLADARARAVREGRVGVRVRWAGLPPFGFKLCRVGAPPDKANAGSGWGAPLSHTHTHTHFQHKHVLLPVEGIALLLPRASRDTGAINQRQSRLVPTATNPTNPPSRNGSNTHCGARVGRCQRGCRNVMCRSV